MANGGVTVVAIEIHEAYREQRGKSEINIARG